MTSTPAAPPSVTLERTSWDLFYDGASQPSARSMPVHTPIDGSVIAEVALAEGTDVDRAVRAADRAATDWGHTSLDRRISLVRELGRIVRAAEEELAYLDAVTVGIPVSMMRQEIAKTADIVDYYAGIAHEIKGVQFPSEPSVVAYTRREPYRVVGQIYPFNHPFMFTLLGLAPALLAGNCVVTKPADQSPLSSLRMAELFAEVLPTGVFNVVAGTGPETGAALAAHPLAPRIAYTGSVSGGKAVLAAGAAHVKNITLELGGKNPLIVLEDADLDLAVAIAIRGMNLRGGAGQSCQSNSRILIDRRVEAAFRERLVDALAKIKVGDPREADVEMGPQSYRAHYERVLGYLRTGLAEGATLVHGGPPDNPNQAGFYLDPTVFADVTPSMTIAREEIFGPVISIVPMDSDEQIVEVANGLSFGLNARIVTRSYDRALTFVDRLDVGTVWVNEGNLRPLGLPMGGHRQSGIGAQISVEEILSYTQEKAVVLRFA